MTTGSHYTVLARRFRPQAFDDVVGQEHVARALQNAIRAGRVAHAYMFTGARGVGKTSMARILAKALNCPNVVDGVPCNKCEICDGITAGNDVDVLEIDGASHRGIDDIRSLRANVGVRSMRTQYKVYIIDEVHMLTKEAFNALLKTLEEPPPNVKFVFCTTEPNKVPDTILSRCQRFDFSSITDRSIADRLRDIAKIEGFEVAEDALELVARRARGSMRDSQSLFDQLLAFSDGTVSAEDVHRMLGTAGDERLTDLFDAIIEHRPGEVLAQLDTAFGTGVQPGELMDQCIGYVRDLIVTLSGGTEVALCSVAGRHREKLLNQAARLGMHSVMAAFQILADAKNQMFRSTFARTVMEMAMVQLSLLENLTAISDLLSGRLPMLPEIPAISASPAVASAAATSAAGSEKKNSDTLMTSVLRPSVPTDVLPELEEGNDADEDDVDLADTDLADTDLADTDLADAEPVDAEPVEAQLNETGGTAGEDKAGPASLPAMASSAAPVKQLAGTPAANTPLSPPTLSPPTLSPPTLSASPLSASPLSASPQTFSEVSVDRPVAAAAFELSEANCRTLLEPLLKSVGLAISTGLRKASDLILAGPNRIEIVLDSSFDFARKMLDQPENRARIESEIQKLTGRVIGVSLRLTAPQPASGESGNGNGYGPTSAAVEQVANGRGKDSPATSKPSARQPVPVAVPQRNLLGEVDPSTDPFVRQVIAAFGATVVKVTAAPAVQISDPESQ